MKKNINAFTLVEIIVVVTILTILSTIWFVLFSSYLSSSRDTNRIIQLDQISKWLSSNISKWKLFKPEDWVEIRSWVELIGYEWYAGQKVLTSFWYSKDWVDPKDWSYFWYYLTKNRKYFQLVAFLENWLPDDLSFFSNSNAVDYSKRTAYVKGQKLWILMDQNNVLVQDISSVNTDWFLNIDSVTLDLKAYLTSSDYLSGSLNTFIPLKKFAEAWGHFCSTTNTGCIFP